MKKILRLLSVLTISGFAMPNVVAAKNNPSQKQKSTKKDNFNKNPKPRNQYKTNRTQKINEEANDSFKNNPKKDICKIVKKTYLGKIKNNDQKTILNALSEKNGHIETGLFEKLQITNITPNSALVKVEWKRNQQATFSEYHGGVYIKFRVDPSLQ